MGSATTEPADPAAVAGVAPAPADHSSHGLPACPLCGPTCWEPGKPATFLRPCPQCGVVLHDRSRSRQEEERHYNRSGEVPVQHERMVGELQWSWVRSLLDPGTSLDGLRVLDIGCGRGAFIRAAAQGGVARAAGLEIDPSHVESCRADGLEVFSGSLFDAGVPNGLWDVVTFWDVLEHLEHPQLALEMVRERMAPGGTLILRGRNASLHVPCKSFYRTAQLRYPRLRVPNLSVVHRWGLAPRHWTALVSNAGFNNQRLHPGIPTPGDRYRTLGAPLVSLMVKKVLSGAGTLAHRLLGQRGYWYPSVLISARTPDAPAEHAPR